MRKGVFSTAILFLALTLTPYLSPQSAQSAVSGDFLLKWGDAYHVKNPRGMARDKDGYLYVADTDNNKVAVYNNDGVLVNLIEGYTDYLNSGDLVKQWLMFNKPMGVAVDDTYLYVVDNIKTYGLKTFKRDGTNTTYVRRNVTDTAPGGIAVNDNGTTFYTAPLYHSIVVTPSGPNSNSWPLTYSAINSAIKSLNAVAVDKNGYVYASDNQ